MRVHPLSKVAIKNLGENFEEMVHLLNVFATELNGEAANS